MTSLAKTFQEKRAAKKASKPYQAEIVTSDFIDNGTVTNNLTGRSYPISLKAHFSAVSKTKVDPQKGLDSVLWDINQVSVYQGRQASEPYKFNMTYKEMLRTMLIAEKLAADELDRPDAEFIAERKPLVPKNNILKFV